MKLGKLNTLVAEIDNQYGQLKKDLGRCVSDEQSQLEEAITETVKLRRQKSDNDLQPMPPLERDEEDTEGKRLKILTQNKLLTRLSALLAQIKDGHNSNKLNNEIRQNYIFCINIIKSIENFTAIYSSHYNNGSAHRIYQAHTNNRIKNFSF